MTNQKNGLRVALLAGSLGQGGAEKQLVYTARALCQAGVQLQVYSLTRGEVYEAHIRELGIEPVWVGKHGSPALRLLTLIRAIQRFQPHIIQSTLSFTNLYASLLGRLVGAMSLGALRGSLRASYEENGRWNRWQISTPTALFVNSRTASREVIASRLADVQRVYTIPNVIDLVDFDHVCPASQIFSTAQPGCIVISIGRLVAVKRHDRFLRALARARQQVPSIKGIVVGDGPERKALELLANDLDLSADAVAFVGGRNDVAALLQQADIFVFTSDIDEGFPNVILEAMAARLPVITTPAGDAGLVVDTSISGYVVPFDNVDGMAACITQLATTPEQRNRLGEAGRQHIEQTYSFERLANSLLSTYRLAAQQAGYQHVLTCLTHPWRAA